MNNDLFRKYDIPAPRYTSYPTVPYWSDSPTDSQWVEELRRTFDAPAADGRGEMSWSLYVHIPYCETLCTFCGCNTSITKDHSREEPYVELLLQEWRTYLEKVPRLRERQLRQIHLGGGTPTFLSANNLKKLLQPIMKDVRIDKAHFEGSIEVDPRRTTREHLVALRECGFTRVSMGVQDFNPEVQRLVNRVQPIDITERLSDEARSLGYDSVNFDLIYGLPRQTPESVLEMAETTVRLRPDRIALYSFALVPWIKPAQRLFKDEDLPVGSEKRRLYEISREVLLRGGYVEIGMDHFALPTDALARSEQEKTLHRNFMGYVDFRTEVLLGLGVSAISETPGCFHQNEKVLPLYERRVLAREVPTLRGHLLSDEDRRRREQILRFMTRWEVELESDEQAKDTREFLAELIEDGLVKLDGRKLTLTDEGRPFLRNACMALDARLRAKTPDTKVFSQSV